MERKFTHCPNCCEALSILEYESQECYECGWPSMDNAHDDTAKQQGKAPEQTNIVGGLTPFTNSKFINNN